MADEVFYSAKHWAEKARKSAETAERHTQQSGRIIQIGYNGVLDNGQLVFRHIPGPYEVPYELFDDYEYEVDLNFDSSEELPLDTPMIIKNGPIDITFVSTVHRQADKLATVGDMLAVMRRNNIGYRWLFKAAYKITTDGRSVLLLYPVVGGTTVTYWE